MRERGVRLAGLTAILLVALKLALVGDASAGSHRSQPNPGLATAADVAGGTFHTLVPLLRTWPPGVTVPASSATRPAAQVSVSVSSGETGRSMPTGFLGFSIEYTSLRQYLGADPSAVDPVFLHLVQALNPAGSPILRIGGNSTDRTWAPRPGASRPRGVTFSLSGRWLAVTRAMAEDLGAWLILGVNLAANNPDDARAEANALVNGISPAHVAALEIGNEPDIYSHTAYYRTARGATVDIRPSSYDFADYLKQTARWIGLFPTGVGAAGPAFALPGWMSHLGLLLDRRPTLRIVTYHRYPLRACDSNRSLASYPTIAHLLADSSSSGLADSLAGYIATAHAHRRLFRLDELNSASCEGKLGVSNTFASSLWVLDTLFDLAAVGDDGVNVHTLAGAAYEPFAFSQVHGRWTASVKPLYYGMLMFARAFPAGARLLNLHDPDGIVRTYATEAPGGVVHVVVINKDPDAAATVHLRLPGAQTAAPLQWLTARSVAATSGVTLDGETFGASTSTGLLPAPDGCPSVPRSGPDCAVPSGGRYTLTLPAGSAVMLTRASS